MKGGASIVTFFQPLLPALHYLGYIQKYHGTSVPSYVAKDCMKYRRLTRTSRPQLRAAFVAPVMNTMYYK